MELNKVAELLRAGDAVSEEDAPSFYQRAVTFIFDSLLWTSSKSIKAIEHLVFALGRSDKHGESFARIFVAFVLKKIETKLRRWNS